MTDETKPPSVEELWDMVKCFADRANDLEKEIANLKGQISSLNKENSGWLEIYQRQSTEIDGLKSRLERLELTPPVGPK